MGSRRSRGIAFPGVPSLVPSQLASKDKGDRDAVSTTEVEASGVNLPENQMASREFSMAHEEYTVFFLPQTSGHANLFRCHRKATGSTNGGRHGSRGPRRGCTAVVGHVGPDEVTSGESSAQTKLTGEDGSRDNTGQLAGVLTRGSRVGAPDTKQVQHRALGLKDGTTTNGADLNGRHGHSDLQVAVVAVMWLVLLTQRISWKLLTSSW